MIQKGLTAFRYLRARHAPSGSFKANVLTLMTGTSIAQAISIAIAPILTRFYTPRDFGAVALYTSMVSVIAVIAGGKYELAIMLPEKDEDAIHIGYLSIIITFFVSFVTFLAVWIFSEPISKFMGNPEISRWFYLIPFSVLFTGIYNTLNYWVNRKKQYNRLAVSRVSQSAVTSAANIGMGLISAGAGGLITGGIAGQVISTGVLASQSCREDRNIAFPDRYGMVKQARLHCNFPKYILPTSLLDAATSQIPVVIITSFFSLAYTGFYSFAMRVLSLPMSLIGSSVSQVFYQEFTLRHRDKKEAKRLLIKTWTRLAMIGLPPMAVLFFFGEVIFGFIFGESWKEAGRMASVLSPMLLIMFISSSTSTSYLTLGLQKISLLFGIAVLIYRPFAFYVGHRVNDFYLGLAAFVVLEIAQIFVYNYVLWKKV